MGDRGSDYKSVWSKLCLVPIIGDDLFCEEKDIAIVRSNDKYGLIYIQRQTNAEKNEQYFCNKCVCPCVFDVIYPLYKEKEPIFFVAYSGEKCCLLALKCERYEVGGDVVCEEILPCLYEHITWNRTQTDALILYGDGRQQNYSITTQKISKL